MKRQERNQRLEFLAARLTLLFTWSFTLFIALGMGVVLLKAHKAYSNKKASSFKERLLLSWETGAPDLCNQGKKAAIIIDGLGGDMQVARRVFDLEIPVTIAILPYRRYSEETARGASDHGKEVLLHLPLQPYNYPTIDPGAGCLLLSMDRSKVQSELDAQIKSLPFCVGINTYMGSLFTEKREFMAWVFSVLQERDLFFVDSLATPASVSQEVAKTYGVGCFQRTHLLDENRDIGHIIRQLCQVADFAAVYGKAVGIGHPYPETLAALPKALAAFKEKGVDIVLVSEIFPSPHRRAGGPLFEEMG